MITIHSTDNAHPAKIGTFVRGQECVTRLPVGPYADMFSVRRQAPSKRVDYVVAGKDVTISGLLSANPAMA